MTRNRIRKTTIGTVTEESMRRAVNLVIIDGYSIRQAAEQSTGPSTEYLASPATSFNSAISCDKFVSPAEFEGFP